MRDFANSKHGQRLREGRPSVYRAAMLAHIHTHRVPRVYDHELIIGNMSSKRAGPNYYPEGSSVSILEDLGRLDAKAVPLHMSPEERMELIKLGSEGVLQSVAGRALLRRGRASQFLQLLNPRRYFVTEEAGVSHQAVDYDLVVNRGLGWVERYAQARLDEGRLEDGRPLDEPAESLFQSACITAQSLRAMAERLADEAQRLADQVDTPALRRQELLQSARACRQVPYGPARTFQEGLQAVWLVHVALNLEDYEQGLSFGRLDQVLWPLLQRDIARGRVDHAQALELIGSFQLKCCETMPLFSERVDLSFSGNTVGQAITLGGVDAQGRDCSNALSHLFLDAFARLRTREPNLQLRVHEGTPDALMDKAVEVLQLGAGSPALFGDVAIVPALEAVGMSTEHARDYAVIGCVELLSPGRTYSSSDAALFNLPLCLELALNQGRPMFKASPLGRRMGAATPRSPR